MRPSRGPDPRRRRATRPGTELGVVLLVQLAFALSAARGAAEGTPEQVRALEAKIADTPAQSIDLTTVARVAATGGVPVPVIGTVVPASAKLRGNEARFVALAPSDEQSLADFSRAQHRLSASAQLFRGALRMLTAEQQPVTLKGVAFVPEPLRFRAQNDRFEGRVSVGLVTVTEGAGSKLATPVLFQLIGDVSSTPRIVPVDHIGPPYAEIVVTTPACPCPFEVQVVSAVTPDPASLSLTAVPAVRVRARPAQIRGLGLASTDLTFELVGPRQGLTGEVQLSTTLGQLAGRSFQLLPGHAVSALRSQSIGLAELTVGGPGLDPGKLAIEFTFPWWLLLAAAAGGLVGGLVHSRLKPKRNQAIATTLFGVLAAVLYVWGMEHAPLELPFPVGEMLIFVLATLGAYYGAKLYAHVAARRAR